jgi:CheY-like chemotaxis protein
MGEHKTTHDRRKAQRSTERRNRVREVISAPVRIRGVVGPDRKFDETTTTINFSPTGILIETSSETYYRTMRVVVTLPFDESTAAAQTEQEGRIVRISEPHQGRRTVAIALSQQEETAAAHQNTIHSATPHSATSNSATGHSAAHQEHHHEKEKKSHPGQHQEAPAVTGPASQKDAARATDAVAATNAPLILVVESETTASEFMKTYLTGEGYEVITVQTSAEAHLVLDQRIPSLLIAEVEGKGEDMPGYSLCSHMKQTPRLKPVPVMLITSSAYPSDYAKAHKIGAVVCMAKPFKRDRLGHVVKMLAPPPNASDLSSARNVAPPRQIAKPPVAAHPPAGKKFRLPSVFGR